MSAHAPGPHHKSEIVTAEGISILKVSPYFGHQSGRTGTSPGHTCLFFFAFHCVASGLPLLAYRCWDAVIVTVRASLKRNAELHGACILCWACGQSGQVTSSLSPDIAGLFNIAIVMLILSQGRY